MTTVITPYDVQATGWQQSGLLERGEAEAIALALQLRATWLPTDDTAARVFATALGFEVHGSLGIVLWAAARGHLSRAEAAAALDCLADCASFITSVSHQKAVASAKRPRSRSAGNGSGSPEDDARHGVKTHKRRRLHDPRSQACEWAV